MKTATTKTLTVTVDYDLPWKKAIERWKDTLEESYVWNVEALFPKKKGTEKVEFTLLNFPNGESFEKFEKVAAWGKENELVPASPQELFSLDSIDFLKELGQSYGYIISPLDITFGGRQQACYVWWFDSRREADLHWVGSFGSARGWFAFRKPSASETKHSALEPLALASLAERVEELEEWRERITQALAHIPDAE